MNALTARSNIAAVVVTSALLLALVLGGASSSAASGVTLPDMQILVPTDKISIGTSGTPGHRQLQFTHITWDAGTGPFEIDPTYNASTGMATFTQAIYSSPSPGVWTLVDHVPVAATGMWNSVTRSDYNFPHTKFTLNTVSPDGSVGGVVATSPKTDYCITGDTNVGGVANTPPATSPPQSNCTDPTKPLGWSVGWGDEYDQTDHGQPIDLTGVPDGTYDLRAIVDPQHVLTESNPNNNATDTRIQITGNTVNVLSQSNPTLLPPSVTLTSPSAGAQVSGQVTLSASASAVAPATVASVQFLLDGLPLGNPVTAPPYTYQWTVGSTPGSHLLSARVTDSDGDMATATSVPVIVPGPGPTGGGPGPTGGGHSPSVFKVHSLKYHHGVLTVVVTGLPTNGRLSVELKFAHHRPRYLNAHGSRLRVRTPRPKSIVLRVHVGKKQVGKAITATLGKGLSVHIINPIIHETLSGTVPVFANASDDVAVSSVQFSLDGRRIGRPLTKAPYVLHWRTSRARSGAHRLAAVATDASGNRARVSLLVTVQNPAPPMTCFVMDKDVSAHGQGATTTPAFDIAAPGETLLAFVSAGGPAGAGQQTATVSGGGLTWKLVKRANASSGDSEIWTTTAHSVLTISQITSVLAKPAFDQSLTVIAMQSLKGLGSAVGASGTTGAPHAELTTRSGTSLVFAVGNDSSHAVTPALPFGWVPLDQWLDTGTGNTFWSQYTNQPTGRAGTKVAVKISGPATDQWNLAAVELVSSGD